MKTYLPIMACALLTAAAVAMHGASAQNVTSADILKREKSSYGRLTPSQKKQVDKIADQFEKTCLAGPALPENTNKAIREFTSWSKDPAICSCIAERARSAITPAVLAYNQEQSRQFMLHFGETDIAECGVPTMKKRFAESCERLMTDEFIANNGEEKAAKRIAELGYKDVGSMIKGACSCINTAIRDITPQQWAGSALTKYQEYLEKRRTGHAVDQPAFTPLDEAMSKCFKPTKSSAK